MGLNAGMLSCVNVVPVAMTRQGRRLRGRGNVAPSLRRVRARKSAVLLRAPALMLVVLLGCGPVAAARAQAVKIGLLFFESAQPVAVAAASRDIDIGVTGLTGGRGLSASN